MISYNKCKLYMRIKNQMESKMDTLFVIMADSRFKKGKVVISRYRVSLRDIEIFNNLDKASLNLYDKKLEEIQNQISIICTEILFNRFFNDKLREIVFDVEIFMGADRFDSIVNYKEYKDSLVVVGGSSFFDRRPEIREPV